MYELFYVRHINIKFYRNYVTCYFREFYFEENFEQLFNYWDKGWKTLEHQLQSCLY